MMWWLVDNCIVIEYFVFEFFNVNKIEFVTGLVSLLG